MIEITVRRTNILEGDDVVHGTDGEHKWPTECEATAYTIVDCRGEYIVNIHLKNL